MSVSPPPLPKSELCWKISSASRRRVHRREGSHVRKVPSVITKRGREPQKKNKHVRKKESKKKQIVSRGFLVYLLKFVFVLVSLRLKESVRVASLVVGGERILRR